MSEAHKPKEYIHFPRELLLLNIDILRLFRANEVVLTCSTRAYSTLPDETVKRDFREGRLNAFKEDPNTSVGTIVKFTKRNPTDDGPRLEGVGMGIFTTGRHYATEKEFQADMLRMLYQVVFPSAQLCPVIKLSLTDNTTVTVPCRMLNGVGEIGLNVFGFIGLHENPSWSQNIKLLQYMGAWFPAFTRRMQTEAIAESKRNLQNKIFGPKPM